MKSCIVLQHVRFEGLGLLEAVLKQNGFEWVIKQNGVDAFTRDEWLTTDLVVILGGPIGVYEQDKYPWLQHTIAGLKQRLALNKPTLGICLGAQLIACALGAAVYPNTQKEIGWSTLDVCASILPPMQPVMTCLQQVPVLHWHGDTFDLPIHAQLLASTACTPNQAFSVGHNILALQFHVEVDVARIEEWLIGHTAELHYAGLSVPTLREQSLQQTAAHRAQCSTFFNAWLQQLRQ